MLLIYNVDRRTRRTPWVTYGLMALNTFIFLLTIFVANFHLGTDSIEAERNIKALLDNPQELRAQFREFLSFARKRNLSVPPTDPTDEQLDQFILKLDEKEKRELASYLSFMRAGNKEGYKQHWQIENMGNSYVMEPHYTVTNMFAYRPSERSWAGKILGILGSMFLHGSIDHLLGNMLFLWVFGRALEDTLGGIIYIGAYIVAGIAATLLFHVITMEFSPDAAGVPLMGASGAIAGLMGLFAVRFYRTPVRISPFMLVAYAFAQFLIWPIVGLFLLLSALLYLMLGKAGIVLGVAGLLTAIGWLLYLLFYKSRGWAWQGFKIPAVAAMVGWMVFSNLKPAVAELSSNNPGGVAYWAHIGGFLFGAAYAFAIGARDEGAAEYMLDDAQKAISSGDAEDALRRSQAIITGEKKAAQNDLPAMKAQAYEVQAQAYARQNNKDAALENYEQSIVSYLNSNDRDAATRVYLDAVSDFPLFVLPPPRQLIVASHLATKGEWEKAAENLNKIPYTFPDAPESEIATLRLARLHLEKLDNPAHALQLSEWFIQRYPHSEWIHQAKQVLQAAQLRSKGTASLPPQ
jgi:membrane associated rhomboid family serine protease/TolA-binding protein